MGFLSIRLIGLQNSGPWHDTTNTPLPSFTAPLNPITFSFIHPWPFPRPVHKHKHSIGWIRLGLRHFVCFLFTEPGLCMNTGCFSQHPHRTDSSQTIRRYWLNLDKKCSGLEKLTASLIWVWIITMALYTNERFYSTDRNLKPLGRSAIWPLSNSWQFTLNSYRDSCQLSVWKRRDVKPSRLSRGGPPTRKKTLCPFKHQHDERNHLWPGLNSTDTDIFTTAKSFLCG